MFDVLAVVTGRPRIDGDQIQIGNAAFAQGDLHLGVLLDGRFTIEKFISNDRGLNAGNVLESRHRLLVERYRNFVGMT